MFGAVYRFELRYHAARPVTWLYAAIFFGVSFAFTAVPALQIGNDPASLVRNNAPVIVSQWMFVVVLLGQIILPGLVGTAVLRDYQVGAHELLFATSITKSAYLGGRFVGVVMVMLLIHLMIPVGMALGSIMPWVESGRLLPFSALTYIQPYVVMVVPTVLALTAIFFAVGALTRSLLLIYVQGMLVFAAWSISQSLVPLLDNAHMAALLDPFGIVATNAYTKFWSPDEQNRLLIPLSGDLLANRLVWIGVAIALFGLTFTLFRFRKEPPGQRRRRRNAEARRTDAMQPVAIAVTAPHMVTLRFGASTRWNQYLSAARLAFRDIVRSVPFLAIMTIGIVSILNKAWAADSVNGQLAWLETFRILEVTGGDSLLYLVLIATIYAGELVWRERQLGLAQVIDAAPTPSGALLFGKFTGLAAVHVVVLLAIVGAGAILQTLKGYQHFEFWLAIRYSFGIVLPAVLQYSALALMVHAVVNHKVVGHVVVVGVYLLLLVRNSIGLEHPLFDFAGHVPFKYSDMNGFGPFAPTLALSATYWSGVAILLGAMATLSVVRGTDPRRAIRLVEARRRFRGGVAAVATLGLVVATFAGGTIYYNTNVLNRYQSSATMRLQRADYERTYRKLLDLPQPRLVHAEYRLDLEPDTPAARTRGIFTFVNAAGRSIDTIVVTSATMGHPNIGLAGIKSDSLAWSRPVAWVHEDAGAGIRIGRFNPPLVSGDTVTLTSATRWQARGFTFQGPQTEVVGNGVFTGDGLFPHVGYREDWELRTDAERRKEGLPLRPRSRSIDDSSARSHSFLAGFSDADWITIHTTLSTAPDQMAVAPGALIGERKEGGRRVFEYRLDHPVLDMAAFMSGRYSVRRDRWNGIPLEIYYHAGHEVNLDDMMAAMKATLEYHSTQFSPYQNGQLRIVEVPRYRAGANALAGTIPYSEDVGFMLRKSSNRDDLDFPYFAVAHETAHQWWGHQLVPAAVQGAGVLVEGLAEYTSLTVMERRHGPASAGKFLRYELDAYLRGRGAERRGEKPLILAEGYGATGGQGYVYYRKSAMAFYALRDLIGEDSLNTAIRRMVVDWGQKGPPYVTTRELMGYLRAVTADSLRPMLSDLFETITMWENRTDSATAVRRSDGTWLVRLKLTSAMFRGDSLGTQSAVPVDEYVDIGVFGEQQPGTTHGKRLYFAKRRIMSPETVVEIVVPEKPLKAGIDPYNKLIDRTPSNNVIAVTAPR